MDIVFQGIAIIQILFISLENGRAMHDRVQRGPFLEEDVNELVRD